MKRPFVKVLVVIGLLVFFRFVVPLGLAAHHFSSTPTMREWAKGRAVEDSVWDRPAGDVVREARKILEVETSPLEPERFGAWKSTFTFTHGNETLLNLSLEVRYAAEEVEDWLKRGVNSEAYDEATIHASHCEIDPDFHAVVVCTHYERSGGGRPTTSGRHRPTSPMSAGSTNGTERPGEVKARFFNAPRGVNARSLRSRRPAC